MVTAAGETAGAAKIPPAAAIATAIGKTRFRISTPYVAPRALYQRRGSAYTSLPHHRAGSDPEPVYGFSLSWNVCVLAEPSVGV